MGFRGGQLIFLSRQERFLSVFWDQSHKLKKEWELDAAKVSPAAIKLHDLLLLLLLLLVG